MNAHRSGGVTAAATVLIVVSAVMCFGTLFGILGEFLAQAMGPKLPAPAFARAITSTLIILAIAIWGIVTGVGILRVRRWAWWCVLAISALLVADAIPKLFQMRKLIRATTGVPTVSAGNFVVFEYIGLSIVTFIPIGLGLWWILLFARRSVRAQFFTPASALGPGTESAQAFPRERVFVPGVPNPISPGASTQTEIASAPYTPPPTSPSWSLSSRRPVSITVIAIFLLIAPAFFPALLLYPKNWRIAPLFGHLFTGNGALLVQGCWAAVGLALGLGLLFLKPWARLGTIALCLVGVVNGVLVARRMGEIMNMMQKAMNLPTPPPQLPPAFQHFIEIFGIIFGSALNVVALYFLITRRAAFYPPAAPASPAPGPSNSIAPSAAPPLD